MAGFLRRGEKEVSLCKTAPLQVGGHYYPDLLLHLTVFVQVCTCTNLIWQAVSKETMKQHFYSRASIDNNKSNRCSLTANHKHYYILLYIIFLHNFYMIANNTLL